MDPEFIEAEDPRHDSPVEDVRRKIAQAIIDRRILPRTALREGKLASALGVSRARVREALGRLEAEHLVVSIANRGAFVAAPTLEEARQVFDARCVIESEIVRRLAEGSTPAICAQLRECLQLEREAWAGGDRLRAIAASRSFHNVMTELAGNQVLADLLRNVIGRLSLAVALFGRPNHPDCMFEEHAEIVGAIEQGDSARASRLMLSHLDHLGQTFVPFEDDPGEADFDTIFKA